VRKIIAAAVMASALVSAMTAAPSAAGATIPRAAAPPVRPVRPAGASSWNNLYSVACPGRDACVAVGATSSGALAEVWNGTKWKLQPIPNPKSYGGGILQGVSCSGPAGCAAVGNYDTLGGSTLALAEGWTGKAWLIRPVPAPAPARTAGTYLNGVSCHATAACVAVGEYLKLFSDTNVALAERWDGRSWRRLTPVTPGYRAILEAVVCPRADRCVAVGQYYNLAGVGFTLAEGWNGTTWTVQSTPNP
jgi:hypothetical protein